jgi:hypothetical protein
MTVHGTDLGRTAAAERTPAGRKGVVETVIDSIASGLGNSIGFMADYGVLFLIFAIIWVAFGAGLLLSQGTVDAAWQWVRELPLVLQGVVWLLFLPVMVALWIWETTWPLAIRLILVIGIGGWNLFMFLPRALMARP